MSERRPYLWCLFDKSSTRTIEGLLFDEARAYVSNLDASQLENWYVWKEDWPDWRPAAEVEGLTEMIFRVMHVSPPPPPRGTEESSLRIEPISAPESTGEFVLRTQKRFNKRLQVTIVGEKNQQFKTFTRDVSVGGMYVEDSLPDWVDGYFKVRMAKPSSKQLIELTCCLIENQTSGEKFRLAILPLESIDDEKNLETWLAA